MKEDSIVWIGGGEFSTLLTAREVLIVFLQVALGIRSQTAKEIVFCKPIQETSTDWLENNGFAVTNLAGERIILKQVNSNTWRLSGVTLMKAEMTTKMMNLLETHSIK